MPDTKGGTSRGRSGLWGKRERNRRAARRAEPQQGVRAARSGAAKKAAVVDVGGGVKGVSRRAEG